MLFGYFTLFVALLIEIVGAYYSITGLAAIFSGAVIPILIMGGVLELGKVTAAVWLKNNWERASYQFKAYLLPAVIMLMLITSMGIFGFLSKAHNDQNLVSGDVLGKIAIYDEKIKIQRDNIESARRALQQMDAAVDQTMSRSQDEKGADKATAIRRGQARERGNLQGEIARAQTEIVKLNDLRAPIAAEVRKVEAEVGPIKYIAKLIYDDNPDSNILEKAVVWMIVIIVAVFDPLALVLILAAQQSIRWAHGEEPKPKPEKPSVSEWFARARERARFWDRKRADPEEDKVEFEGIRVPGGEWIQTGPDIPVPNNKQDDTDNLEPVFDRETDIPAYEPDDGPLTDKQIEQIRETAKDDLPTGNIVVEYSLFPQDKKTLQDPHTPGWMWVDTPHPTAKEEPEIVEPPVVELPVVEDAVITTLGDDYIEINGKRMHHKAFDPQSDHAAHAVERHIEKTQTAPPSGDGNLWVSQDGGWVNAGPMDQFNLGLSADNAPPTANGEMRGFGTSFPTTANKGDMFLRVDQLPSALYKFNGTDWIEVDKALSDQHAYDEAYIDHLIEKISTGEYDPDLLSNAERDSIEQRLSNNSKQV
jgi:hypothetical protein